MFRVIRLIDLKESCAIAVEGLSFQKALLLAIFNINIY